MRINDLRVIPSVDWRIASKGKRTDGDQKNRTHSRDQDAARLARNYAEKGAAGPVSVDPDTRSQPSISSSQSAVCSFTPVMPPLAGDRIAGTSRRITVTARTTSHATRNRRKR